MMCENPDVLGWEPTLEHDADTAGGLPPGARLVVVGGGGSQNTTNENESESATGSRDSNVPGSRAAALKNIGTPRVFTSSTDSRDTAASSNGTRSESAGARKNKRKGTAKFAWAAGGQA